MIINTPSHNVALLLLATSICYIPLVTEPLRTLRCSRGQSRSVSSSKYLLHLNPLRGEKSINSQVVNIIRLLHH